MENHSCRVLLVEDNEDDYLILRDLLDDIATTKFDLQWVDNYKAARVSLLNQKYDVCFLDYRLGESNGVEIVREFASLGMPFILLTGNEDFEVDVAAAKAGSADFLIKGHINAQLLERSMRYAIERKKTEAALLQAQNFAQATVDALPSCIAVLDEEGIILNVNAAWRKFGEQNAFTDHHSGIGTNYLQVCEAQDGGEGVAAAVGIRAVISGELETFSLEYECHAPTEQRWFRMGVSRFVDGGPRHVVVAHENITESKVAANALRASEERFQSIVASVPGMVYQFVMQPNGTINWTFISEGSREIFEEEPESLLANPSWLKDVIHPEERAGFEWCMADSAKSLSPWRWEGRHRMPSGKSKWMQGAARLVDLPDGATLWNGLIMDITALKEAEEERDRFFTMSLDLLAIAGMDGYFKRVNPAFSETLGYTEAELLATPFLELSHPDDREATEKAVEALAEGIHLIGFENRYRSKGETWRWLEWKAVANREDGLIYAAARDVTQRKEAAAALRQLSDELEARVLERTAELAKANESLSVENIQHQLTMGTLRQLAEAYRHAKEEADLANNAKSEFLSRMSHELRTPLNSILGFSQILESHDLPPRSQESVSYILQGGRHLLDLINEVLDLARVEAGRIELSMEPISLREVVQEACALVLPLAAQRKIHINQNIHDGGCEYIQADRQRFRQVLINLLGNAIKYNRESGQVIISCSLKPDNLIGVAVTDTGLGISPENLAKLFTPFERLGASNVEGTGLGLVLSQRLVIAMGGTLRVESTVGTGTTFTIGLSAACAPEKSHPVLAENSHLVQVTSQADDTHCVLCIEDNLSNLKLMEAIFEKRPRINMVSAHDGTSGVEMARHRKPDLILLDLNLPDMQAPEILLQLQGMPETTGIPVIVVSADATPNQIERLLLIGADDYLTKPLNISQFLKTVDKYLEGKEVEYGKRLNQAKWNPDFIPYMGGKTAEYRLCDAS